MNNQNNRKKLALIWLGFLLIFGVLNLFVIRLNWGDDLYYQTFASDPSFSFLAWTRERWLTWSSRLLVDNLTILILRLPPLCWRALNILSCFVTVYFPWKMLCSDGDSPLQIQSAWLCCALFSMIPLIITAEAGWQTTTLNYSWPAACVCVSCYPLYKLVRSIPIRRYEWLVYIPVLLLATDTEQCCAVIFGIYVFYTVWVFYSKKYSILRPGISLLLISLLRLIMVLICPGDAIRSQTQMHDSYPEYAHFHIFQKFQAGMATLTTDFFLIFFSITFILTAFLCWQVWHKEKSIVKRLPALVPLCASIIIPCLTIGLSLYIHGHHQGVSYQQAFLEALSQLNVLGTRNTLWTQIPLWGYACIIFVFICIFFSFYILYGKTIQCVLSIGLLALGCAAKGVLGFSPTVWLSHSRTGLSLVLSEICVLLILYHQWDPQQRKKYHRILLSVITILAAMNLLVTYIIGACYTSSV